MQQSIRMYIVTAVSTLLLAVQPSRSFTLSSYPPGQHGHQLRGFPVTVFSSALDGFSNAEYLDLEVFPHKPLGCTAEESLTESAHVFVSKVVDGGNAEKSGVRIGDVIVGVSGLFGEVEDVSGLGIDRVKGLVAGRPQEEPLVLRIARGTTVLQDHEKALVDLCSDPTLDGKESEECIVSFLKEGYNMDLTSEEVAVDVVAGDGPSGLNGDIIGKDDEEGIDGDNLVADMYSMWAEDTEDFLTLTSSSDDMNQKDESAKEAPKPWSSRSSPSGTYVRDPVTGSMRNIDA